MSQSLTALLLVVLVGGCLSTAEDDSAYLVANAEREDVVVLSSGLQYRILESGPTTGERPTLDSTVDCHYEGRLTNGEVFDSTYKREASVALEPKDVVKGWTEALQLMRTGDKWELTLPSELGYGSRAAGGKIPPNSVLIFTMEILNVTKAASIGYQIDRWLHETAFTIFGFRFTRMTIGPPIMALMVAIIRVIINGPPVTCTARHICNKREALVLQAKERYQRGEDFGKLAMELSECKSKEKAGSLGTFEPGTMAPEFDKAAFNANTKIGVCHGPVRSDFGFHIFIIDARKGIDDDEDRKKYA